MTIETPELPTNVNFCQWIIFVQGTREGKPYNRGYLQKERFCQCVENPCTAKHYTRYGMVEKACKYLSDEGYIPYIMEFNAEQVSCKRYFNIFISDATKKE